MIKHQYNLSKATTPTSPRRRSRSPRRKKRKTSAFQPISFLLLVGLLCVPFALGASTPPPSQEDQGPIIGIDLGTTYSCVSVYENGSAKIIANDQGNRITPSIVAFTDTNERLVGDAALNQATINPENTIYDVKRLIGRDYSDASVQEDKKLVPFEIIPDKLGNPRIRITRMGRNA